MTYVVLITLNPVLESEPVQLNTCVHLVIWFSKCVLNWIILPLEAIQSKGAVMFLRNRQSTTTMSRLRPKYVNYNMWLIIMNMYFSTWQAELSFDV